jgi:hypothetical protein
VIQPSGSFQVARWRAKGTMHFYCAGHRLSLSRPLESCFAPECASPAIAVLFHGPTVSALILVAANATLWFSCALHAFTFGYKEFSHLLDFGH